MSAPSQSGFVAAQRLSQAQHFARTCPEVAGFNGAAYRLPPASVALNLAPSIREAAADYFTRYKIAWHQYAAHGLSSQVCCLNFLMPLATRPELLAQVIGNALNIPPPKMMRIEEGAFGEDWYIGFEWIGRADYLNEWPKAGKPRRGANVTSADAVVRFSHEGRTETLLIEWKYTEAYGQPIPSKTRTDGKPTANEVRTKRYQALAFAPDGPVRDDLGLKLEDFFWEPFYQLLRQQMLASGMQKAREEGAERVRVLHISPSANHALHKVTSKKLACFGDDAFEAFSAVLVHPEDFIARTTGQVFGRALREHSDDPWANYVRDRYTIFETPEPQVGARLAARHGFGSKV